MNAKINMCEIVLRDSALCSSAIGPRVPGANFVSSIVVVLFVRYYFGKGALNQGHTPAPPLTLYASGMGYRYA